MNGAVMISMGMGMKLASRNASRPNCFGRLGSSGNRSTNRRIFEFWLALFSIAHGYTSFERGAKAFNARWSWYGPFRTGPKV